MHEHWLARYLLEFLIEIIVQKRRILRPLDMPGLELLRRSHIEDHEILARLDQLFCLLRRDIFGFGDGFGWRFRLRE